MLTSGVNNGISTTTDTAVPLIQTSGQQFNRTVVVNTSTVAGFVSIDNGSTWAYLPAATATSAGYLEIWHRGNGDVLLKRIPSGLNLTGVFAFVNWINE